MLKHLNVKIPGKLIDELKIYSDKNGILMRKIVELAIIDYIKKATK